MITSNVEAWLDADDEHAGFPVPWQESETAPVHWHVMCRCGATTDPGATERAAAEALHREHARAATAPARMDPAAVLRQCDAERDDDERRSMLPGVRQIRAHRRARARRRARRALLRD